MTGIQPIDIAIFLVSFAACIYCILLSRRLKSLQDTRDGLGATIMAMNKSVSAVSSATFETRAQAGELADRLSRLMKEANQTCTRMEDMIATLESQRPAPVRHETAPAESARRPEPAPRPAAPRPAAPAPKPELVHSAENAPSDLEKLISEMRAQQSRLRSAAQNTEMLFEEEPEEESWITRSAS